MKPRKSLSVALLCAALMASAGCAVQRGQQTMGAYVDDAAITTSIKTKYVESKAVDANAISVETLNGTVMLSGFAKSATEKSSAETIARNTNGVKAVRNEIVIKP
ncbi:MAG: BON domain-containing protein [Burkholderiaceae bacterium]